MHTTRAQRQCSAHAASWAVSWRALASCRGRAPVVSQPMVGRITGVSLHAHYCVAAPLGHETKLYRNTISFRARCRAPCRAHCRAPCQARCRGCRRARGTVSLPVSLPLSRQKGYPKSTIQTIISRLTPNLAMRAHALPHAPRVGRSYRGSLMVVLWRRLGHVMAESWPYRGP